MVRALGFLLRKALVWHADRVVAFNIIVAGGLPVTMRVIVVARLGALKKRTPIRRVYHIFYLKSILLQVKYN